MWSKLKSPTTWKAKWVNHWSYVFNTQLDNKETPPPRVTNGRKKDSNEGVRKWPIG